MWLVHARGLAAPRGTLLANPVGCCSAGVGGGVFPGDDILPRFLGSPLWYSHTLVDHTASRRILRACVEGLRAPVLPWGLENRQDM